MNTAVAPNPSVPSSETGCLIRVEGVNHSQFIFDTADLSTVRGGGLLLLNAIEAAANALKDCETISSGASSGLFRIPGADPTDAIKELRAELNKAPFAHASFVVAAIRETGDFSADNETLIALNRHEQMNLPSLQVPLPGENGQGICTIDRIRPAVKPSETNVKEMGRVPPSAATFGRRRYGLAQKQAFYADTLGKTFGEEPSSPHKQLVQAINGAMATEQLRFADQFADIADDPTQGQLHGKLAVLYADGNGFGQHQRNAKDAEALSAWDRHIKTLRRDLLAQLIEPYFRATQGTNDKVRIETLLWGGDEVLFVVPAWKGLDLAKAFLKATQNWQYPAGSGQPLTHAMGLVFCHSNTPIARVQQLAHALADHAKDDSKRQGNSLHTVVLESFDHVGASWTDYLQRTYRGQLKNVDRFIKGDDFNRRLEDWSHLKRALPKGRLHDHLQALLKRGGASADERVRLTHDLPDDLKTLLTSEVATPAWFFLAAELWDYLPDASPAPIATAPTPAAEGARA